jgi:hypothetical protein
MIPSGDGNMVEDRRGMVGLAGAWRWMASVFSGGEGRALVCVVCDGKGVSDAPTLAARPIRALVAVLSRVGRDPSLLRARPSSWRHLLVVAGVWPASRLTLVGAVVGTTGALSSCSSSTTGVPTPWRIETSPRGLASLGFARSEPTANDGALAPPWKLLEVDANMPRASPTVGPDGIPIVDLFPATDQARRGYAKGSYGLHGCWGPSDLLCCPHGRYNTQPESLGLYPWAFSLCRLRYPSAPRVCSWSGGGGERDLR